MARQVITVIWCDIHQKEEDVNEVASFEEPIRVGDTERLLAACEACAKEPRFSLLDLREMLLKYGTPTPEQLAEQAARRGHADPDEFAFFCPHEDCPRHVRGWPTTGLTSARTHMRKIHHEAVIVTAEQGLVVVEDKPLLKCPSNKPCDAELRAATGVSAHMRTQHPDVRKPARGWPLRPKEPARASA